MSELPIADRFSDNRSDHPHWNESVWFSLAKPEEKINGVIQYYFRPNMGLLNGGPILWDPSGTFTWNCLHYDWSHLQVMPPGASKFDMTAPNSLSVKLLEPLKRYAISYNNNGLEMDLIWEAIAPVHELKSADTIQEKNAKFHIEQPGRMKGSVKLGGRDIAIDCFSMRDASAGPREYGAVATGGYFWGIAADSSFHGIAMGEGAEQKAFGGFIWKDGQMSSLASGTLKTLEYGSYSARRVLFQGTDKLGRSISATGEVEEGLIHTGYTTHTVAWSLCKWDWDGVTHWGELQAFRSAAKFRQIARKELALG